MIFLAVAVEHKPVLVWTSEKTLWVYVNFPDPTPENLTKLFKKAQ